MGSYLTHSISNTAEDFPHIAAAATTTTTTTTGTRYRSWLQYATNRKVAVSIFDGVIGIFHLVNPSGSLVALGSNQPLTEVSTKDISWG